MLRIKTGNSSPDTRTYLKQLPVCGHDLLHVPEALNSHVVRHGTEVIPDEIHYCNMFGKFLFVAQYHVDGIGYVRVDSALHRKTSDDTPFDLYKYFRRKHEKLVAVQKFIACLARVKEMA